MHIFFINKRFIMKKIFILHLILLFLFSCYNSKTLKVKAEINKEIYTFEVAATSEARKTGLMYRKKINKNSGMLFVYGYKSILSFYMKNTLIPLDIAFIDEQFVIVDIQQMKPLDETSIISKKESQYALEVNRGFFDRVNLKVGDKINFITPIPYPFD